MLKSLLGLSISIFSFSILAVVAYQASDENKNSYTTVYQIAQPETLDSIAPLLEQLNALYKLKNLDKNSLPKIQKEIEALKSQISMHTVPTDYEVESQLKVMDPMALCPDIKTVELIDVAGFANTDELVMCGRPDTLAYVIFIEEPGDILGAQMTLTFSQGMQYAGFELTHYSGTTISNLDPDPLKPSFLLEGITDAIMVAYVGVEATCDAQINGLQYRVDVEYNFTFQDTFGNIQTCRQKSFPTRVYNSTMREPVLNYRSVPNVTLSTLEEEYCHIISLSQDGIGAYTEDLDFSICGLDLANELQLNSIEVNGRAIPYNYDGADSTLTVQIDGSYFVDNANSNPADENFDENERVNIELCYQVDDCPLENTQVLEFKTSYGCNDEFCQTITQQSEVRIRPSLRPEPFATLIKQTDPAVCGDPGVLDITFYAAQPGTNTAVQDSASGLFTDVTLGFETCDQSSLVVGAVIMNGTALPDESTTWVNGDLIVDFTNITTDPDGPGGMTDADGDGFFDDLPGGEVFNGQVFLEFSCAAPNDPNSLQCSSIDCSFAELFIAARRDCGQAFSFSPDVTEFSIINGATYLAMEGTTLINNSFFGYDFGTFGNDGACNPRPVQTRTLEFCYVYEQENVIPCGADFASNELEVLISGSTHIVQDFEFVAGSGQVTVNGAVTQSGVNGTFTTISEGARSLNLPMGSSVIGDTICFSYQISLDTALCVPPQFVVATHQAIEKCETPDCSCTIVKACEQVTMRADPTDCGCDCDIASGGTVSRWNTGYTDPSSTTKRDREDIAPNDLNRFLPCDTMLYEGWMVFNSEESISESYQLFFVANATTLGINGWRTDETELTIDASGTELLSIEYNKPGSARMELDPSQFSDCLDDPDVSGSTGFLAYAAETPYEGVFNTPFCGSSFDYHDGSLFGFYLRNFNILEDCRGTEVSSWEESDCLEQIRNHFNFEIGDSIHMTWLLPLTKNPRAFARRSVDPNFNFQPPQILNVAAGHYIDPFDTDCLVSLTNCRENTPYQTFCPQDINAITEMELDDCGGTVVHRFNVVQSTPVNWYENEYRPYFKMEDISVPIFSPSMYCGNARLITSGGVEYPLTVKEFVNHECVSVGVDEYCSVSDGSQGTITFNPLTDGFPGLAVGYGGLIDSFRIEYDLCRICPAELSDVSEYQISYDYRICDPLNGACFRCWVRADGTYNQLPTICSRTDSDLLNHNVSYYDAFDLDTLYVFQESSEDFTLTDNSNGFPPLELDIDRNIMASGAPGISVEENLVTICSDGTDLSEEIHKGVTGSVSVQNSVIFQGVTDTSGNPIASTFSSTDATSSTYAFELPDLAPGDCVDVLILTTLAYCPVEPEVAEICLNVTSGCLDREVLAAVVPNATGCNEAELCYMYITEESGLQATFIEDGNNEYPLCGTIPISFFVKNVKLATLTDLALELEIPIQGINIVPGSFMASYPNSGDLNGTFYAIPDPSVNGNILTYAEDADFSTYIHQNGLPGVAATQDSNHITITFLLETGCDSFLSGSYATLEATASDPCSPEILSSGVVNSDQLIVQDANPNDFAKILVTAEPSEAFCGQSDPEFTITGLNISEKPSGDSVEMCIVLPDVLDYIPGSMRYVIPADQSVGVETVTMIGTSTEVCFAGYNNMPVGGQFTLNFDANFDVDTPCGDHGIGVQIKELRPQQPCTDGSFCDVYVQSSVNDQFDVSLKGPLQTAELKLFSDCATDENFVTLCYEALLENPGLDYSGTVTVDLHEDLDNNFIYDFYDPLLDSQVFPGTFVTAGESIILEGCFDVPVAKACPVILNVRYETECNCDNNTTPFTQVIPSFAIDLPSSIFLCPDEKLTLDSCGNYLIQFDPAANVMTTSGTGTLEIMLVDPSVSTEMSISGVAGACDFNQIYTIEGIELLDLALEEATTCQDVPLTFEVDLPSRYQDFAEVTWSPDTLLDDNTLLDPIFSAENPGDYTYALELVFSETCTLNQEYIITVFPNGDIGIRGDTLICFDYAPGTAYATPGFDTYEWFRILGGFEIIQASTSVPEWTGPLKEGKYIVKGFSSTQQCPSVSDTLCLSTKPCHDLEFTKTVVNLPDPFTLGSAVTYELVVCNVYDSDVGLIFDATDVQIVDQLPGGVTYLSHTHTNGSYSPGSNEWDIDLVESGTCDTLLIEVAVDDYGCIINDAQVTSHDKEDVDSTPNNDDGDQSEDDEDWGKVEVDTFDLSLTKALSPLQTVPVTIGSAVTYEIEVCNQGEVDAYDIQVVDYVPTGMMVSDPSWSVGGATDEYFITVSGPITPGNCQKIPLVMTVVSDPNMANITNFAEISEAEDANGNNPPDLDSTPDNDPDNDGLVIDQEVTSVNGDEDDHDPASIPFVIVECTIANNIPVCPETPMMFIEIGENNVAWKWSGPDGFTSSTKEVTIDPPVAGMYNVTVTDANGLTSMCSIEAEVYPELQLQGTIINVSCNGGEDGALNLDVLGGTAPFSYDWSHNGPQSPDTDSQDVEGLKAGAYSVVVQDANGCINEIKFDIEEPDELECRASATNLLCNGDDTGEILTQVRGGVMPYEYALDGAPWASGNTSTGVAAGPHTVTVRDANGCLTNCEVTLKEPDVLTCSVMIMDASDCSADNGTVQVIPQGGTPAYQYQLDDGAFQTSSIFSDLSPGTYALTVLDANGCTTTCVTTLTEPGQPACTILEKTDVTCNQGTDGALTIAATGGSGSYEYSFDGMSWQTSQVFNNLSSGLQVVTVRNSDSPNCTSTCTAVLTEPSPISCALSATEVSCNGFSDATIMVAPSGGLGNYEYSIVGTTVIQTTQVFEDLSAGSYTIEITDNGDEFCAATCSITIVEPQSLVCSLDTRLALCNGEATGSITINSAGGTTPYEYSLDGGPWQPGNVFVNLDAGNYTVTTRDANGCLATCAGVVSEPTALACATTFNDLSDCEVIDGSVFVFAAGGVTPYQYAIDGGTYQASTDFTNLMAGTHIVSVRDANGCVTTCEVSLNAPSAPKCTITATVNIDCNGESTGSITVSGSEGTAPYEFSLDNLSWQTTTHFNGLTAGMYPVYVRNASSPRCVSMCATELTEPAELTCSASSTDVLCKGGNTGTATLVVDGGVAPYAYRWSDGQLVESATDLAAGYYEVTVTDENGCSTTCGVEVLEPELLTCVLSSTRLACNGDVDARIIVTAAGGSGNYEYSLNGTAYQPGNTFFDLDADVYNVTVRDENECTSVCSIAISEPTALSCTTTKTDVTDCLISDGTVSVHIEGGTAPFTYSIDNGVRQDSDTFTGLGAGSYILEVTDANGCTSTCAATVEAPSAPMCAIAFISDISCKNGDDGSISVVASAGSGAYEFSLNSGDFQSSPDFINLTAGDYTVTVRNMENPMCISTCFTSLTEPEQLVCTTTGTPVSCKSGADGQAMVLPQGGTTFYTYLWSNGSTSNTANNLTAGTYMVTVTDAQGCTAVCSSEIQEPTVLEFTTNVVDVECNGDASGIIIVNPQGATAPYDYSLDGQPWQPGNIFVGIEAGTHVITVRDNNSCFLSAVVVVDEPSPVSCSLTARDVSDCGVSDGVIIANGVGGVSSYTYSLDGGSFITNNIFTGLMPGHHIVTIQDGNECTSSCEVFVDAPMTPMCQITNVVDVECYGFSTGEVSVIGMDGTAPYEFSIDNSSWQSSGSFSALASGIYTVYVRNSGSPLCVSTCSFQIEQPEELQCQLLSNDPLCYGASDGNITVLAAEGTPSYEYSLNGSPWQPSPVFFDLSAGDYEVTIRDRNDCTITCEITLVQPPLLECTTTVVDLLCKGDASGMITLEGTGGVSPYDYNIDGGFWQDANSFSGLSGGDYVVYIRDEHDCVSSCLATINEPPLLECSLVELIPESCAFNDGRIEVAGSGGTLPLTYSIDGGTTVQTTGLFTGLTLGTYTITIIDANGCVATCIYEIVPDCFDLALTKKLATPGPYTYGQTVIFDIEVINQGNIDATDIEVTDHLPCGFSYDPGLLTNLSNNWTLFVTSFPMTTINSLLAQSRKTLQIEVTVEMCTDINGHVNVAEISEAYDGLGDPIDDVDSQPDFNPNNDAGGEHNEPSNNQEDGNGTDDEDDHDPEFVPIFDVSLEKDLVTEGPYQYGQLLEFSIEVCNQSSPPMTNVTIVDHIPVGYSYADANNSGWSQVDAATSTDVSYTLAGPIAGGACMSVPIFLTLEMAGGVDDWKNIAEITLIQDENGKDVDDVDSDENNDDGDQSEDDEDYADPEITDVALVKTTTATGPFAYGDTVTYDIEVYNQGNVDLYNIEVNDFLPCGQAYLGVNSPLWTIDSGTSVATATLAGPILPGDSATISIAVEVQACTSDPNAAWTNIAEIASFEDKDGQDISDEDIDSDADDDPSNDVTEDNTTDNAGGDEDDNDPETIEIYDLAQIKQLVTAPPYRYGDLLEYSICVINQGNVTANSYTLTDHLPSGLGFAAADNLGWDATNAPIYDFEITTPLVSGDTICISKFVTFEMTSGGANNYLNISEISEADGEDADSNPDNDPDNDGHSTDDSYEDEEDDHDPENFEVVDLALSKTTIDEGPFAYGDAITFDINVYNQGNVDMYNVVVNDFIPCGYEYLMSNDGTWLYDGTSRATTTIAGPISAGSSETVSITLTIQECVSDDAWKNVAEIENMEDINGNDRTDDDVDSDGDDDPDNDGEMEDNVTNGDNGDEDDSDFEEPEIFDLSQDKTLVTSSPYGYGDLLEYSVCVTNQGNVTAQNIVVTDYLPSGLSFDAAINSDWDGTNPSTPMFTFPNLVAPLDTVCVTIYVTVEQRDGGPDSYTNTTEITDSEDEEGEERKDVDSTEDDDPDNDPEEEDDHDEETFALVDLALCKTTIEEGPFAYGDAITFDINVYNQGNVDMYNVVINDFIPCGYEYLISNDGTWLYDGTSRATTTIAGPIAAGSSETVSITLTIQECVSREAWKNVAEIESMEDQEGNDRTDDDVDSDGDDNPDNDGEMEDNVTNGDNGDEDDSDSEEPEIFDLALIKTTSLSTPQALGDKVVFTISIVNHGNVPSTNILINEYLPAGFAFDPVDNPGWDAAFAPVYTYLVDQVVDIGDTLAVPFVGILQLASGGLDAYTNAAEIGSAADENGGDRSMDDADSMPDSDSDNDGDNRGDNDNSFDDSNNGGEDDYDEELVQVVDIALRKTTVTSGEYTYGQQVTFAIELVNQGIFDLYNVKVNDFIPCGFEYLADNNVGWSYDNVRHIASRVFPGPLLGQSTDTLYITLELAPCLSAGAYTNTAEVESMEDRDGNDVTGTDVDSVADADPSNDGTMENDDTDNNNGDEDDSDFESLEIFDLALIKQLVTEPMYAPGDILEYAIAVHNQGTVPATNIVVWDHLPAGLSGMGLNPGWTRTGSSYSTTIDEIIIPGESLTVSFFAEINFVGTDQENYTNYSEIGSATDLIGDNRTDADSTPDNDPDNDGIPLDDQLNDKGDEDDHDPEIIVITQDFIPDCVFECQLACVFEVNLSLSSTDCEALITPANLIAGLDPACAYDDYYQLTLIDEAGNHIADNIITAEHIGQRVRFRITNQCGNSCWGYINVEDRNGNCSQQNVSIVGNISTESYQTIEAVLVEMSVNMPVSYTDEEGNYAFGDMPSGGAYQVIPSKNDDPKNGISTLDLILIQRHILGVKKFDSPYQYIAADIDRSSQVDGVDLIELRKLILGIYDDFPDNESWRFIDDAFEFAQIENPWVSVFPELYTISILDTDMEIDFIGVKVGDINGDVEANHLDAVIDARSSRWPLVFRYDEGSASKGEVLSIPIYASNYEQVSGWQGTFMGTGAKLLGVESRALDIGNKVSHLDDVSNSLTVSYGSVELEEFDESTVLFELIVEATGVSPYSKLIELNSSITVSEGYRSFDQIVNLELEAKATGLQIDFIKPNPWKTVTDIEITLDKAGRARLEFYDVSGRLVLVKSDEYEVGSHTIRLWREEFPAAGMLYVKLISGGMTTEKKMILLD